MMKNFIKLIFAVTILVLASCSPKFYTPNTQNVPLLTEKGETNLTLAGNTNQVEFQGAYAVTQHFALQANGDYLFRRIWIMEMEVQVNSLK